MVSFAYGGPGYEIPTAAWEVDDIKKTIGFIGIDPDYIDLMDIDIIEGRNISWDREGDRLFKPNNPDGSFLINQATVREYDLKDPLKKKITIIDSEDIPRQYDIVGITNDFHFRSIHNKVEPLILG